MAIQAAITITFDDIDAKRAEVRKHDEAIARHTAERAKAMEWLRAAEVLTEGLASMLATGHDPAPEPPNPNDLTAAIEKLANEAPQPITKATLRDRLREQGFAEGRLVNYFYTAIMRLKKRGRIIVLRDGRVWKCGAEEKASDDPSPDELRLTPLTDAEASHRGEPGAQGREAGPGGGT